MGAKQEKQPKPTIDDTIIELKMASKKMERESAKSLKQSQQYMKKAKDALKKNDEEGAKLYLQSSASKRQQSISVQRMALKMNFIGANIKNMQNNQTIMDSFQSMGTAMGYINNPNFQMMANNMQNFQKSMDQMLINAKMMQELMNQQNPVDTTADNMLDILKGELAMQAQNQVDAAGMIQQKEIAFIKNLKNV